MNIYNLLAGASLVNIVVVLPQRRIVVNILLIFPLIVYQSIKQKKRDEKKGNISKRP